MAFNRLRNRSGTSLAEVLVVTVILVTGILVVMRVFPVGFNSLRHAENVSIAGRLAQQEMGKWNNRAANLPAGILPVDQSGNLLLDLVPGPPINSANAALGGDGNPAKNSECFRKIIGEATKIPTGAYYDVPGQENTGAIYVLGFSPINILRDGSGNIIFDSENQPQGISIYGGDMQSVRLDSTDNDEHPWEWLGSRYAIDYDREKICFAQPAAGQSRTYHISYSYWTSNVPPRLKYVVDGKITVESTSQWMDIPGPPDLASIDEDSEQVAIAFMHLADDEEWSWSDPYQYVLVDPVIGIVALNPHGYEYQETTEMGGRTLEARINYELMDLQIISEERTVPAAGPYEVKLTLPFIKQKGQTIESDGSIFAGLGSGAARVAFNDNMVCPDVLIVNPADGVRLFPRNNDPDLPGQNPAFVMDADDFKKGAITFGSNLVTAVTPTGVVLTDPYDIAGKTLRFYYQADNDWSVQLHKTYELYTGKDAVLGADMNYRQYLNSAEEPNRLLFKLCDAEKTVSVTYKWKYRDVFLRTEVGETHQLDKYITVGENRFVYLDLKKSPVEEIVTVAGVSVKARAIWRERDQWMYSDIESSLLRRPTD